MTDKQSEVTCIGLANVDVVATVDENFITEHHIAKAASTLLDASTTGMILGKLHNPAFYPGGCAANTASGLGVMGIKTRFIGYTGDDTYAEIFKQGFQTNQVEFNTLPFSSKMTSTCLTLITPDKDRSFAFCTDTAGWFIAPENLPDLPHDKSQYVYLEANTTQMWGDGKSNLLVAAVDKYTGTGVQIIINLNDREIVSKAKDTLLSLLSADIAFFLGNISEAQTLFDTDTIESTLQKLKESGGNFAITDGPNGAYIITAGHVDHVPGIPLHDSQIINTLGAGDQFAAGFVAGLAQGLDTIAACKQGIENATRIIQEVSARPDRRRIKR